MDSLRDQMLRLTYRGAASVLGPVIDDRPPADLHGDPRARSCANVAPGVGFHLEVDHGRVPDAPPGP